MDNPGAGQTSDLGVFRGAGGEPILNKPRDLRAPHAWRRWAPSLAAAALYAVFAALFFAAPSWFAAVLNAMAPGANPHPFGDLGAVLQAASCWRQGVDVYAHNACMQGGIYNYSPLLLYAADLPAGMGEQVAGGILLGLAFIAGLALLPAPNSRAENATRMLAACSCPVIWGLEQSNFDLVMFLFVLLGLRLLRAGRRYAVAGYLPILLAAACKFYPVILLGLLPRERLAQVLAFAVLGGVAALLFATHFARDTAAALQILPAGPPFTYVFGAMNVPFGMMLLSFMPVLTLSPSAAQFLTAAHHPGAADALRFGTIGLTLAALIMVILTWQRQEAALRALDPWRGLLLLGGAMIIAFCFFAAQNLEYRAIFFLLALPGLWSMASDSPRNRVLCGLVLLLLWEPLLRGAATHLAQTVFGALAVYPELAFWALRELAWWWVAIQLTALAFCFATVSARQLAAEWRTGRREAFFTTGATVAPRLD